MSWNIELTLNTDYRKFESWLNQYRLKTTPFIVNLEEDKTLHVIGGPTLDKESEGFRYHQIKALIGKPSPSDPQKTEMSWYFPVIMIELFEPANSRLNVKIECTHAALESYYLDLLKAIVKLYPEAGQIVLDYLSRLRPDYEAKSEKHSAVDPGAQQVGVGEDKYIFDMGDEIVHIRYRTEQASFKKSIGLQYLRYLLFAPNQDIEATQLVIGFSSTGHVPQSDDLNELQESRDSQDVADEQAIREYKERLIEIMGQENEFGGLSEKLEKEKLYLIEAIEKAKGLGGRTRVFTTESERARTSVTKAIKQCMDKIKKTMPTFADHLSRSIQTGHYCRYSPQESVRWANQPM